MRKFAFVAALAVGLALIPSAAQASWLSKAIHRVVGDDCRPPAYYGGYPGYADPNCGPYNGYSGGYVVPSYSPYLTPRDYSDPYPGPRSVRYCNGYPGNNGGYPYHHRHR